MNVYVTSDTHFCHRNILKYEPATRPWDSVDEMDEALIERWNAKVKRNDIIYHLGDLIMGHKKKVPEILSRLNGEIHLVLGNHDRMLAKFDQKGILNIKPLGQEMLINKMLSSIQTYTEVAHKGKNVMMSHYSMTVWNKMHYGSYMLFGHSHGNIKGVGKSMDVGIDACEIPSNGAPFLLDDVLDYLDTKKFIPIDHHR